MIRNQKPVNPRDPESEPIYQLETAMGSAIAVFPNAGAIRVPRTRFSPVKTTNDLLAVRSDIYILNDKSQIIPSPERDMGQIIIDLDPKYYKMIDQLDDHFPYGAPSLLRCQKLTIKGDVKFGKQVVCKGTVSIENESESQVEIPDDTHLEGEQKFT